MKCRTMVCSVEHRLSVAILTDGSFEGSLLLVSKAFREFNIQGNSALV